MPKHIELSRLDSPIGPLLLAVGDGKLVALDFDPSEEAAVARLARTHAGWTVEPTRGGKIFDRVKSYFDGRIHAFDDIPVAPVGTPFQLSVWRALRTIPVGRTISYLDLAKRVGKPAAMRAVGAANGKNPVALVIPCHRVIASDGKLHGYGGGLPRKAWLLRHEGALPPELDLTA
jgi:methylated-DNA-[protein]-cysteine S-methyltransferase